MKLKNYKAFTIVEILIVVTIIGLLAAIGVPNLITALQSSQENAKQTNIKMVDAAKEQWALENNKTTGDCCNMSDISDYLKSTDLDVAGESIVVGNIGTMPYYN